MNFNRTLAIECAEAIRTVYNGTLPPTFSCADSDTQVRVEEARAGEFVVIFPGTASARDWMTDLRVRKVAWHTSRAHGGFVWAWRTVAAPVLDAISGADSVIITGHSLGGALATLCADAAADMGVDIEAVYTFGSPRVGNAAFARQYNEDLADLTWRVVNARDPVPHVPWMLGTYRHVATQVYLGADQIQVDQPLRVAVTEAAQSLATMTQQKAAHALFDIAQPHHISSYLKRLEALRE